MQVIINQRKCTNRETLAAEDEIGETIVADLGNTTLLQEVESCKRRTTSGCSP
jgi:hypothetical protein